MNAYTKGKTHDTQKNSREFAGKPQEIITVVKISVERTSWKRP